MDIVGTSQVGVNGPIRITNVRIVEQSDNVIADMPSFTDTSVDFGANFTIVKNDSTYLDERYIMYEITLDNDSIYSYVIGNEMFNPYLNTSAPNGENLQYAYEVIGINPGEAIKAKTTSIFNVKLSLYPSGGQGNYIASVSAIINVTEEVNGIVVGSFKDNQNSGNLTGQSVRDRMVISVMNTNNENKTVSFKTGNNNFRVVDQYGNPLGDFVIPGNSDSYDCEIYIERVDGVNFTNSPQKFNIYMVSDDGEISVGVALMEVDVDESIKDNEPPVITSLSVSRSKTENSLAVTWNATDNIGVDHYDVILYNSDNNVIQIQEDLVSTSYIFSDISDGSYYVKVIAYDGKHNSGFSNSSLTNYVWTYSVNVNCTSCSSNKNNFSVSAGSEAKVTLTGDNGYNNSAPTINSIVVTDVETGSQTTLSTSDYSYTNGELIIRNISGNVDITASGVANSGDGPCLIEGTKILLYNGQYKNIEDIDYNDLVMVWNHDNGKIGYEYPAWIEQSKSANEYTLVSFSDGSSLGIVGEHSIFSTTLNKYVTVNTDEFKEGIDVIKYDSLNNSLYSVTVTKIERVREVVKYYHVITTRYFNMITNDILTTYEIYNNISNFPGFDSNLKWVLTNEINKFLYTKDDFPNISNYVYNTFRLEQTKFLIDNNLISRNDLDVLLNDYPMILRGIKVDSDGNKMYMVTTSDISNPDSLDYLVREGSNYIVPYPKNNIGFKYWYNHSDNKVYYPLDNITIYNSIYLEAIYE